jgi:iron complex outermembrane recepter protein
MKTKLKYSGMLGIALAGAALMGGGSSWAQSGPADEQTASKDTIIVTGTRTTGLSAADSPAPIQVIGADILGNVGQPDLIQALAQNIPSFNAQAFGGDTANLTLSAKLRGLSPNHALVLINGKRRHGTSNLAVLGGPFQGGAAADLNFVPLASVDHIEVLLEGAAAQYGSDAIAGVINIIQKQASSGGELRFTGGQYFEGDGKTAGASANIGFAPLENAYLNLTAEARYHGFSNRGAIDPRVIDTPFNTTSSSRLSNYPGIVTLSDYPYLNKISGDAEYRLYTTAFNAGIDISDTLSLYAFGSYGHKFAQAFENYRVPSRVVGSTGDRPRPFGFSPKESITENDYALTVGANGDFGGWLYDIATTYGKDDNDVNVRDSQNASLYFDTGASPTDFHAGDFIGSQWTTNFDISHAFDVGLAGPLNFAAGLEYREDGYEIKAGDAASRYKEGSQSYPGFSLTDAGDHKRDSKAAYVNVAVKPIEPLQLDAAVRYEDFSDFGDTTVYKLTGRFDFNDAIALRGTASTGFRAPTLAEGFYSATNVSPTSAFVQLPPNSAAATLLGLNGLQPEESKNYSVGFVLHPDPVLSITIDAFQIEIENRIVGSGALFGSGCTGCNSPNVLAAIIANGNVLDPTVTDTGVNIFSNGLDTRTRGVDVVMTYASDYGEYGSIDWSLAGSYTKTDVTRIAPPPSGLAPGVALFDATAISDLETASPEYRVVAGALWNSDKLSVNLKATLYGPSSEMLSADGGTYYETTVDTKVITDLDISYAVSDSVTVSVGANNLLNEHPEKYNQALLNQYFQDNNNAYVSQYAQFSPYGINGGYYYAKVGYTF